MINVTALSFLAPLEPGDVWGEDARLAMIGKEITVDGIPAIVTNCEPTKDPGALIVTVSLGEQGRFLDISKSVWKKL